MMIPLLSSRKGSAQLPNSRTLGSDGADVSRAEECSPWDVVQVGWM